jgi:hypothetical protein
MPEAFELLLRVLALKIEELVRIEKPVSLPTLKTFILIIDPHNMSYCW